MKRTRRKGVAVQCRGADGKTGPLELGGKPVFVADDFLGLDGGELANLLPGLERLYHSLSFGLEPDEEDGRTLDLAAKLAAANPILPAFIGAAAGLAERVRDAREAKHLPKAADLAECKAHFEAVQAVETAYFSHLANATESAVEVAKARAELAEAKGNKASWRERKRQEGNDRARGRLVALLGCIQAGMTVKAAAEKERIPLRTAERILAAARKNLRMPNFPRGRRKSVEAEKDVGIEEAERLGARRGR